MLFLRLLRATGGQPGRRSADSDKTEMQIKLRQSPGEPCNRHGAMARQSDGAAARHFRVGSRAVPRPQCRAAAGRLLTRGPKAIERPTAEGMPSMDFSEGADTCTTDDCHLLPPKPPTTSEFVACSAAACKPACHLPESAMPWFPCPPDEPADTADFLRIE